MRRIFHTWWPLAASWLLMSVELPAVSAVVARLADPEIHLAAYGSVVFPLALIVEAPIIMLLAASTSLSKDWASYVKLRRFMMRSGALLTVLHLLIALTPLYYTVVEGLLNAPPEVVEPARVGLIIMTPWTWSIAYRRFNQGALIRFDHSRAVSVGTAVRLVSNWLVLAVGLATRFAPGIVIATSAVATGVVAEAFYIGLRVRPVVRDELPAAPPVEPPLTFPAFVTFYVPLALTSLLNLLVQPLGSAAMGRMPQVLPSLAIWPVLSGFSFIFRSPGIAFNEVVVAMLDDPAAVRSLRRFATGLALGTTGLLLAVVASPLGDLWLSEVASLNPALAELARPAMWLLLPLPGLIAIQNWYQGIIVNNGHTRGITEAIVLFLVTSGAVLGAGVVLGRLEGLYVALLAFALATAVQTAWLWVRSRRPLRERNEQAMAAAAPGQVQPVSSAAD